MALSVAEQLAEAEAAYHELQTGKAARVVVDQNGERVEFVVASKQALYQYIQSLQAKITPPTSAQHGPAGFFF